MNPVAPRPALRSVNQNAAALSIPLLKLKSGSRPSVTAIPRPQPVAIADVFGQPGRKRPIESASTQALDEAGPVVKKARTLQDQHEAHREAGDRWRLKWVKAFPSLRFYFDTDDTHSRQLRVRVVRMGAIVEPFFSNKVTHLITAVVRSEPAVPDSPSNPFTGNRDLASKAQIIGIKVWPATKLADILDKIAPRNATAKDSLSTLLQDEKQNGTRERDPHALRKDYTYFPAGSHYLLLQDATSRTRPIMAKEFEKEWPILFESYLRISSSNQTTLPVDDLRKRAWSLYVDRVAFRGEAPIHSKARQTPETPRLPEPQPYANASGNSVVITSNIASTSNPSPFIQPTGKVAQMSKRVQVLKTNARAYRPQPDDIFSPPANIPLQQKSFMTQEQVITMLQQARAPRYEVITGPIRRANREKVDARAKTKDQDASTGYCENCRMRFTDLSQHLQSKKHRRFALDPANFASLDSFLSTIARPPNTSLLKREWPPCHDRHRFDARCKVCDPFTYGYD